MTSNLRRNQPTRSERRHGTAGKAPGKPKKRCIHCGRLSKTRLCDACAGEERRTLLATLVARFSR